MIKSPDAATRMEIATALKAVDPTTFGGINDLHEMLRASLLTWAHAYNITDVDNPLGNGGGTPMSDAKLDELKRAIDELKRGQDEAPQKTADALVRGLQSAGVVSPPATPPTTPVGPTGTTSPPVAAPTANVSMIVGKTLDEADGILPPGYGITTVTRTNHPRVVSDRIISYTVNDRNISVVVSDGPTPTASTDSDSHATTATPASESKPSFGMQVLDGATLGISRGIRDLIKKRGTSADNS